MASTSKQTTRFARLTGYGSGALATTAVWGPDAGKVLDSCFRPKGKTKPSQMDSTAVLFGQLIDPDNPDETGEDVVVAKENESEFVIHGHGGLATIKRTTRILLLLGAKKSKIESWNVHRGLGFKKRIILSMLAKAPTYRIASILLDQFNGADERFYEQLNSLSNNNQKKGYLLQKYYNTSKIGDHLDIPWRVVITGRPNVGKSSLLNAILGYQRSIVNSEQGTTRDVVCVQTAFDGWPVELMDVAGIRETSNELEQQGVERAKEVLKTADVIVYVFDENDDMDTITDVIMDDDYNYNSVPICVMNKCDLPNSPDTARMAIRVSTVTGQGIKELKRAIIKEMIVRKPKPGEAIYIPALDEF